VTSYFDASWIYSTLQINWKLSDFNVKFVSSSEHGTEIESKDFEMMVGRIKTKWRIRLCPYVLAVEDDHNYIGIYIIKREESSTNFEFCTRFSIMNGTEEAHQMQFPKFEKSEEVKLTSGLGFRPFLSHSDFFKRHDEFVKNSSLNIRVQVILRAPRSQGEIFFHQSV
jgi:hypothetical protein